MKNERRSQIKAYISEHKSARIEDLAKQNPDVSLMTLRRDLAALEEEGFLVRVRGGAYINSTPPATQAEDLYSRREISNVEAKTIICEKALPFLEEKRSIFFDAGTTLMTLVRRIPDQDLVVFTSAPNIAMEIVMRTTMPRQSVPQYHLLFRPSDPGISALHQYRRGVHGHLRLFGGKWLFVRQPL